MGLIIKKLSLSLFAVMLLVPTLASAAGYYDYSDGWPRWIGTLDSQYIQRGGRLTHNPMYLPRSLIRTGGFTKMLNEVESSNADTSNWPSWIQEIR